MALRRAAARARILNWDLKPCRLLPALSRPGTERPPRAPPPSSASLAWGVHRDCLSWRHRIPLFFRRDIFFSFSRYSLLLLTPNRVILKLSEAYGSLTRLSNGGDRPGTAPGRRRSSLLLKRFITWQKPYRTSWQPYAEA